MLTSIPFPYITFELRSPSLPKLIIFLFYSTSTLHLRLLLPTDFVSLDNILGATDQAIPES